MSDLKDTHGEQAMAMIRQAAARAKEQFSYDVDQRVGEAAETMASLRSLRGDLTLDGLVETAAVALAKELYVDTHGGYIDTHGRKVGVSCYLDVGENRHCLQELPVNADIHAGKYRALLFLVRVKEE